MTAPQRDGRRPEKVRGALVILARSLVVLACIVTVIVARTSTSWISVVVMLVAVAVLIGVLWTYRPRYS